LIKYLPASSNDISWIDNVIKNEFPYTEFSESDISSKLNNSNFCLWCAYKGNIPLGFVEGQFFEETKECRLNAVFVEDSFREKGIGTALVKKIVRECMKRNVPRMFLLVKKENAVAKKLYEKSGFVFEKIHDKIIEGSEVEVWVREI
jgi:ribosomal protein S18 acetylase RimI-like enzyme